MSTQGGGNGEQQATSGSSWWGWDSILQTVKKQSETIISIYKEDLSEFTRTIKEDTLSVVKEVVKQEDSSKTGATNRPHAASSGAALGRTGISTSSSGLSNFFNFMDTLKDDEEEEILAKSRQEKCVKKLQKDVNTYTTEPSDEEDFKAWKAGFNLEAHTVEISQLLSANPKLRAIHNELLPKLTYSVFWERYYYRLEKLLKEEERREKILMRAELESTLDDWGGWEDEDESQHADNTDAPGGVDVAGDEEEEGDGEKALRGEDVKEDEATERTDSGSPVDEPPAVTEDAEISPTTPVAEPTSLAEPAAEEPSEPEQSGEALEQEKGSTVPHAQVGAEETPGDEGNEEEELSMENLELEDNQAAAELNAPEAEADEEDDWGAWE